jgi:hypothetical protein
VATEPKGFLAVGAHDPPQGFKVTCGDVSRNDRVPLAAAP